MAWGKEWPVAQQEKTTIVYEGSNLFPEINGVLLGIDLAAGPDETAYFETDGLIYKPLTKEEYERKYNNKMPTHDPYANPNAHIYYQCACGAILDPGTKSFVQLNNHASDAGWKIRFREIGYVPYCVECGEGVE